jgi:hypothetical protein
MLWFRSSPRVRFPLCAAVLGAVLSGPVAIGAALPSAKLDYKLPKSTTLGEPAIMTARLFNTTGYRIVADFGVNDQTEFAFLHTRPDGSVVRVRPSLVPASRMRTSRLMLRGTSYTALVVLDEWLDLSQIGRHAIDVEFHGSVRLDGGDQAGLKRAARFPIDVKPRDARRLDKRGAEWLKQISTLSPDGEARAAASALTAMKDPVAIPYLELATARTRAPKFVEALTALSSPDARAALERLARSQDPDVRALAERALGGRQGQ